MRDVVPAAGVELAAKMAVQVVGVDAEVLAELEHPVRPRCVGVRVRRKLVRRRRIKTGLS